MPEPQHLQSRLLVRCLFLDTIEQLPAAMATGNLTVVTDAIVEAVDYDRRTRRVTGVRYVGTKDGKRSSATARLVFLNAGAFNSVHLLLNSRSEAMPNGLTNSSGVLGTQIMDHANALCAIALFPQFNGRTTFGNRPTGAIVARYRNMDVMGRVGHTRGYLFQGEGSAKQLDCWQVRGWGRHCAQGQASPAGHVAVRAGWLGRLLSSG